MTKKILGIIPARYASSRFPGKPLVDFLGRPMIWWTYQSTTLSNKLTDIVVATESEEIVSVCQSFSIPVLLTSTKHSTMISRLSEVGEKISADLYVGINGDEPLIDSKLIDASIPTETKNFFVSNLMTKIKEPTHLVDPSNIKVVTDRNGKCLMMSRNIIPSTFGTIRFDYYKHIGVTCLSPEAMSFISNSKVGFLEKVEGIEHLRFVENGKRMKMIEVQGETLSVDTQKDAEKVRDILIERVKSDQFSFISPELKVKLLDNLG